MGFGRGIRVAIWAFMLGVCCAQQQAFTTNTPTGTVNFIPPLTTSPVIKSFNPAHNGRVCSTWGNFHFKTFDGDIFYFPGICNYIFASHCNAAYEDFNIQIRRTVVKNVPTINHITMKLDGVVFEMAMNFVVVNGNRVQLPYSQFGIMVERSSMYMKVTAKMGLVFMWNEDDSILLELNDKYANYTCGLCGDFNGIPAYNEFFSNNVKLTATQFGNMQKMDGPTEVCQDPQDPTSSSLNNCMDNFDDICHKVLTGPAFSECNALVDFSEYIMSCEQDLCLCDQANRTFCICNTFGEYSRQCAHAGGHPLNWRTPELCPRKCPFNMQYQECGSPCIDTCTNLERSQVCEDHCVDGCFCPPGTVLDDINNAGCIPLQECSCTYNGNSYAPGTSFGAHCRSCTCNGGKWNCKDIPCPGSCTVEGGSHISTYDEKHYTFHGDCIYILSKLCKNDTFAVLGELRKCGLTDTETCLKTVALSINGGQTFIKINTGGGVFVNWIYTQLPFSAADVTIFRPSSFFIMIETNFGFQVEIQLVPIMQAFVRLDPAFKGQTCGLCGNFNNAEADDFEVASGVVEGTAAAFANTWKTQVECSDIKNNLENPCALSVENEQYAQHWCGLLKDKAGPFANCHSTVIPDVYYANCLFDTCNCAKSEDCMCATLSSYVRACAAKGVQLEGWRTNVCSKYTTSCPKSLSYSYDISSCQPTCRSLSEPDVTCNIRFIPVDGCTCEEGTYMDEYGKCVPPSKCPCYYKESSIPSGEVVHEDGLICTCTQGTLNCIGDLNQIPVCAPPMVYFDCRNVTVGTTGAECQKSCHIFDMQCYSTQCMSGCMCPSGLVSDGKGSCIAEEECPCIHNEATYKPGEKIKVDCNTCVCKNRMWNCTSEQCLGTCAVYGDGHYITFDEKRFNFNGDCEYTLVQDHCGENSIVNGTFRVVTENIPCGSTGTTCSKSIKVFLAGYELILSEEHLEVVERGNGMQMPYQVRYMGMYLIIETSNGLILMWDKKTSIFIKLSPDFKGQVCGLCGNYDGIGINDFTTRSQSVVGDVLEFGNSWKVSLSCPDANSTKDPCSSNPYRRSWSQRQCSIINSEVFATCHSQIDPTKYYEACLTDACACDTGGDCECFCTAVAAYAQACNEFGVCVAWRTPSICPMFCDYYNPEGECEWHYKPCGAPCMKTCRNPSGICLHKLPALEGCYPDCPASQPYFNEDEMTCVDTCGCYDANGDYHKPGESFYSWDDCQSCTCTAEGLECQFDAEACYCYYEGHKYKYKDVIYNTTDGIGGCMSATCDINGTITREFFECSGITTTTPFTFSTVLPTSAAGTTTTPPVTTVCVHNVCLWSEWYDTTYPAQDSKSGDFETFDNLKAEGYSVCKTPSAVECRAQNSPGTPLKHLNQNVTCSKDTGLICQNQDQTPSICLNYEIKILCCTYVPCESSTSTLPVTTSAYPKATSLESETVSIPNVSISTEGTTPLQLPTTSSVTSTILIPVSTTVSVISTSSPSKPETATSSPSTPPLQTSTIPPVTGTLPQTSPGSTLPPSGLTTTEGTTPLPTQPISQGSTTTLVPPVSTTVSVTSTASPPTPGTATSSAATPPLQTSTIPPVTGTLPQPSPSSTLPPSGLTTTEGTTPLPTQPISQGSTTTLVPPVSTTVSVTSTASPPTPGTATSSAGTPPLQTSTIPPVTGTLPQPSPGSTLPPSGLTTTEGTTGEGSTLTGSTMLLSTSPFQPTSQGSTSTLLSQLSTTVAVSPSLSIRTPATSAISSLTSSISAATEGPITAFTTTAKITSFTSSTMTPCFCNISDDFFSPGDVIYNRTDSTGCSFYALCSKRCNIERFQGPCPTTTPVSFIPSSTIPSLSTAISSSVPATPETSKPTPVSGCPDADPPRKMNESWMFNNCTMATCEGDNRIVLALPPAVKMITCANELPPIKVYDEDGCNYHYECDCVCSGWSNSHYLTFDGTHYTFHDNCTYVLMKQIVPKYNFSILVDNDFCDVADGLPCPRSIIVNYNSMEIVLSSQIHQGERNNKILVNNELISGGFSRDGISVASGGTDMAVEIPNIKSYISFNGLTFTVKMPFSVFGHNTEGQCGTCSNDKVDECLMPSGEVISSCSEMAAAWQVQDANKPNCEGPPVPTVMPTPPVLCNVTSSLCELILSDLFAECHKILMPTIFYESCIAASCHFTNESIPCLSLEMYASLCSANGVCVDWRSKTQGQCPYNCPKGKVYDVCGPLNPVTCNSGTVNHASEHVTEGCFCPGDMILFNSYTDVCVSECACVGPDGMPKPPGATWKSNCQECVCDPFSVTVQCKSLTCQTPETPVCEKEGFIPVPMLTPEDPCCPEMECRCNTSTCSQAKTTCEPGYHIATIFSEGDCCVGYTCEPIPDICVLNETIYQPGMSVPMDSCETCTCSSEVDPVSNWNLLECEPVQCNTACPLGYEYMTKDGECCGECTQVACTVTLTNTTIQVLEPGDVWKPEDNMCNYYKCEESGDQFVLVTVLRTCPAFDPEHCKPEDIQLTPDGCCKTCTSQSKGCKVQKNSAVIYHNECESSKPVELTYCEGDCASSSVYSFETQQMEHQCSCCEELNSHKRQVTLTCRNGTTINYDYIYVEQCTCLTACALETPTPTTTQRFKQEEEQRRTR